MANNKFFTSIRLMLIIALGFSVQACAEKTNSLSKVEKVTIDGYTYMNKECLNREARLSCMGKSKSQPFKKFLLKTQRDNFAWFVQINGLPENTTLNDYSEARVIYVTSIKGQTMTSR